MAFGYDFFGDGFGCTHRLPLDEREQRTAEIHAEMAEAWPELRDRTFAYLAEHGARWVQHLRPWGWWQFEAPERRNRAECEADQLLRLGELRDDERRFLGIDLDRHGVKR